MKLLVKNIIKNSIIYPLFLLITCLIFFWPLIFKGRIPISADTIVGMYYPWRDEVWDHFTAGVPFKNFLITDPVRQQYPWKKLIITQYKNYQWPLWNPYTHSGMPLLANFQTGAFYPLNIIFFLLPFNLAWSLYIFIQPLLASIFTYYFLRHLKFQYLASLFGGLVFAFSGFMTAWLEWGNMGHTLLWLPLILLSIEKIIFNQKSKRWWFIFIFALVSQFFAGHLQISFYIIFFTFFYFLYRLGQVEQELRLKIFLLFTFLFFLFVLLTAIQWFPTFELIKNSARELDQTQVLSRSDWFLPFKHLIQLLVPDFFGNPATANYWGEWNYGEFVSFIGVVSLFFVIVAICNFQKNPYLKFFFIAVLISLIFALPTPLAKLPFLLKIPFISFAQPSRLVSLIDFCLAILAGFGLDKFLRDKQNLKKEQIISLIFLFLIIFILWGFIFLAPRFLTEFDWLSKLRIAQRNLILPSFILGNLFLLLMIKRFSSKLLNISSRGVIFNWLFVFLALSELFRFSWKFNSFSPSEWLFPSTKVIEFLKEDNSLYRFMSIDRRLFPSNFSIVYFLSTISGYDPLYLKDYALLITKMESGQEEIASFNRIIEPANYESPIVDELNVKYILSLQDLPTNKLSKVFQQGETRIYKNLNFEPRIKLLPFDEKDSLEVLEYQPNLIKLKVNSIDDKELIVADNYYPGWEATINGQKIIIEKTANNFRKIKIKKGNNFVEFIYRPKKFQYGMIVSLLGVIFLAIFLKQDKFAFKK